MLRVIQWSVYLLVILLPLSVFWPIAEPLNPHIYPMYVTPGVYLTDLAVIAFILLSAPRLASWRGKSYHQASRITIGLMVVIGFGILSIPFAISPALAAYTALRWLLALVLFWFLYQSQVSIERTVLVFIIGLGIQVLISIGQVLKGGPIGIPGEMALSLNQPGAAFVAFGNVRILRAYGLTFNPNVLGGFLAIGMILGLPLLKRKWVVILWWLLCLGLLLTFSRSAWISAGFFIPIFGGWLAWKIPGLRRSLGILLIGILFISLSGIVIFGGQILNRLFTISTAESSSIAGRVELIGIAFTTILRNPISGIGAGNFPLVVQDAYTLVRPHYVHNVALMIASEVGVIAGIVWYWLWFYPVIVSERFLRINQPWPVVLVGAWFTFGAIGLWDFYPWGLESGRLLSVILLAWVSRQFVDVEPYSNHLD
jgi:O-antigen ligase